MGEHRQYYLLLSPQQRKKRSYVADAAIHVEVENKCTSNYSKFLLLQKEKTINRNVEAVMVTF